MVSKSQSVTTVFVPEPLEPGDRGPAVARLQEAMAAGGFFRDEIDGAFGPRTATAVIAVHKALDSERTASWAVEDWAALSGEANGLRRRTVWDSGGGGISGGGGEEL